MSVTRLTIPAFEATEPLYRRVGYSVGIHGKLIVSFMLLLLLAVSASCWVFVHEAHQDTNHLMATRVSEMSQTLAMAGSPGLTQRNVGELNTLANRLLRNGDLLTIAFFDAGGRPLVVACQDTQNLVADPSIVPHVWQNASQLTQVQEKVSLVIGEYLEVVAPVYASTGRDQLVGYVQVNIAEATELAHIEQIRRLAIGAAFIVLLITLPLVSLLVHGILQPIRHLVAATRRLAAGDLHTQVDIDRNDMIGALARSFNAMVRTISRQQDELEAKVQQRTEQLEQSNKKLEREIAEKNDFLRAVSHDLNAPLRNISGMASMVLMKHRQTLDEDVVHRLERIQKNVEIETDLISELLELSRIKTRRQKMELVEISALVTEISQMLEEDFRAKGIAFTTQKSLPVVRGERLRLRQIFQNLIDNAVKYMGDGEKREIHVGCTIRENHAEFFIRDTGMGVDSDEIDNIFNIFRRGRASQKQNIPGKGVGLAGVKSIVETYNGSVRVESQRGVGSTFYFTISGEYVPAVAVKRNAIGSSAMESQYVNGDGF
ncbi:MAG TPA: ATP-binding protein [Tepidisphaeraceae bacterium]|jgi:signal transduction histidine kinase